MHLDIELRFVPSEFFIGILAELNEQYSEWTDGSYDWAAQTTDFLHAFSPLPKFDETLFQSPLSQRAVNDLLQVAIALLSGDYPRVRDYLGPMRYAFVIGYPRSGGSYLTKELLRTVGLDHTRVSEALAHDGFPELRETWYDWAGDRPTFYLRESIFQAAEFLVISSLYYQRKTAPHTDGTWLIPKKMHKLVYWGASFKMLLGQGRADYLTTVRHPVPTAISIYEKSGGLPEDRRFPARAPRSAIEHWIVYDLLHLGYRFDELAALDYIEAVTVSWAHYYSRLAGSGLFLGSRDEVRLVPYAKEALEGVVSDYRQRLGDEPSAAPEPFLIHDKSARHPDWQARGDQAVAAVTAQWAALGLRFPELSLE
ncbi:hypothetical protein [Acidihalobacter ferrooxydans]|uniref:Sulfotransferase family protein n=1 Tax=Acidihalobacter ferrooxydans TaxID=1765967 RepID=A0A1P8UF40_9GAMM|nr:hypothetical protein [Acidihalobacter ferrooxydans]APZ42467.1 hypothetical protein BW247_04660 [Acidihalobacter ferrooxydans]